MRHAPESSQEKTNNKILKNSTNIEMDFSDWLERERNLMGFNVSKIDKNSRHILENTVKISNTKDQDSRSAIMLESEKGTIMKYN